MKIKKIYGLALAVGALSATSALASINITLQDTVNRETTPGQPGFGGGEFIAQTSENFAQNYSPLAAYSGGFATFCLELNESIAFNTPYTAVVTMGAINGGVGGGNPDTISTGTAWLYSQFAAGTLAGYDYAGAGRPDSAGLLQQAFWYLEEEIILANPNANSFLALLDLNTAMDDSTGEYNVRVLNITDRTGADRQDVLVVVPEASTIMAGALLLLPFGASTLRVLRKKRTV